jgi:hypothetical protein
LCIWCIWLFSSCLYCCIQAIACSYMILLFYVLVTKIRNWYLHTNKYFFALIFIRPCCSSSSGGLSPVYWGKGLSSVIHGTYGRKMANRQGFLWALQWLSKP